MKRYKFFAILVLVPLIPTTALSQTLAEEVERLIRRSRGSEALQKINAALSSAPTSKEIQKLKSTTCGKLANIECLRDIYFDSSIATPIFQSGVETYVSTLLEKDRISSDIVAGWVSALPPSSMQKFLLPILKSLESRTLRYYRDNSSGMKTFVEQLSQLPPSSVNQVVSRIVAMRNRRIPLGQFAYYIVASCEPTFKNSLPQIMSIRSIVKDVITATTSWRGKRCVPFAQTGTTVTSSTIPFPIKDKKGILRGHINISVRISSLRFLAKHFPSEGKKAIQQAIASRNNLLIKDGLYSLRYLDEIPKETYPPIIDCLKSRDKEVQKAAALSLEKLTQVPKGLEKKFLPLLSKKSDFGVFEAVAKLVIKHRVKSAERMLLKVLKSKPVWRKHIVAANVLGALGSRKALPLLRKYAKYEIERGKLEKLAATRRITGREFSQRNARLRRSVKSYDPNLMKAAMAAVEIIEAGGDEGTLKAQKLKLLLNNQLHTRKRYSIGELVTLKASAVINASYPRANFSVKLALLNAIAESPHVAYLPTLKEGIVEKNHRLNSVAIRAVLKLRDKQALSLLKEIAEDRDYRTGIYAFEQIAVIKGVSCVPYLEKMINKGKYAAIPSLLKLAGAAKIAAILAIEKRRGKPAPGSPLGMGRNEYFEHIPIAIRIGFEKSSNKGMEVLKKHAVPVLKMLRITSYGPQAMDYIGNVMASIPCKNKKIALTAFGHLIKTGKGEVIRSAMDYWGRCGFSDGDVLYKSVLGSMGDAAIPSILKIVRKTKDMSACALCKTFINKRGRNHPGLSSSLAVALGTVCGDRAINELVTIYKKELPGCMGQCYAEARKSALLQLLKINKKTNKNVFEAVIKGNIKEGQIALLGLYLLR